MEGDLGWCCSSEGNNWDLHAVVRSACSGGGRGGLAPPSASNDSWLLQMPASKPRTSGRAGGAERSRSKRKSKKSQVSKEVTRVPVGGPPADLWAWRKYGQKPIKGSPYPRGYYRCSTDKDCKARKQVERCPADPATLIVTYTGGDHSHAVPLHRNSLAGTTRNKAQAQAQAQAQPPSPFPADEAPKSEAAPSASGTDTKSQGSPSVSAGRSPSTPRRSASLGVQYKNEEDDDAAPSSRLLLIEGTEMEAEEDDVLVYLMPEEETAPAGTGNGSGGEEAQVMNIGGNVLYLGPLGMGGCVGAATSSRGLT